MEIQVNHCGGGGGLNHPPLILLVTWISKIGFCVPGNQQINANNMVNEGHRVVTKTYDTTNLFAI